MIGILIKLTTIPVRRDCFFIFSEHLSTKRKCINENPVFQSDLSQNNSIASFLWLHNRTLEHEIWYSDVWVWLSERDLDVFSFSHFLDKADKVKQIIHVFSCLRTQCTPSSFFFSITKSKQHIFFSIFSLVPLCSSFSPIPVTTYCIRNK